MTNSPEEPELSPEDAMAVDATPDDVRLHGDADETETIQRNDGARAPVEGPHEEREHDELPQGDDEPT